MLIESKFIVPLPLDQVWNLLDGQRDRTGRRESPVCRRHLWPGRGGKGEVQATVTTQMTESAEGTTVRVVDDITLVGEVAEYRPDMVKEVIAGLMTEFAKCINAQLSKAAA